MPIFNEPPDNYTRTHLKWEEPQSGWMEFDAVVRQTVDHDGEVTEHPVDTAARVADHYRQVAVPITLETIITNSPIRLPNTHTGGAVDFPNIEVLQLQQPIFPGAPTSVGGFDISSKRSVRIQTQAYTSNLDRVNLIYEELRQIQDEARVLTVSLYGIGAGDRGGNFDSMLLKRFQMDQDPSMTNAIRLTLELKKVIFADVLTSDISSKIPRKQRSNAPKPAGKKPATPVPDDPATEERSASILSQLF